MSDAINHYLCAKDALEEVPFISPVQERLFYLGSQGPDIFFYYNVLKPEAEKITLGDLLHKKNINDFFYNGLKTCLNAPDPYKGLLRSYYLGFICHHALDVFTHPFIFYRSGKYLKEFPETKKLKHNHKRYEVQLDMAYYGLRTGKRACDFPIHHLFSIRPEESYAVEYFFSKTIEETFGISIKKGTVPASFKKARRLTSLLSDPVGWKRLVVAFGEILAGDPGMFSTAFYGIKPKDPSRMLNLNNQLWHHPCDMSLSYTDSYPQLCQRALKDVRHKAQMIDPILLGHQPLDRSITDSCFQDLGYDTGLDWNTGLPIRYFDPVL